MKRVGAHTTPPYHQRVVLWNAHAVQTCGVKRQYTSLWVVAENRTNAAEQKVEVNGNVVHVRKRSALHELPRTATCSVQCRTTARSHGETFARCQCCVERPDSDREIALGRDDGGGGRTGIRGVAGDVLKGTVRQVARGAATAVTSAMSLAGGLCRRHEGAHARCEAVVGQVSGGAMPGEAVAPRC